MAIKAFPFTAEEMRGAMKATITECDMEPGNGDIVLELRIKKPELAMVFSAPKVCVPVPLDEWREMTAWVARQEKHAAAQQPARGDASARARGGA